MTTGMQILLWKRKKPKEDRSGYRPITIGPHEMKLLDGIFLRRLQAETTGFLPNWAFGFVEGRACRDAILVDAHTDRRVVALDQTMEKAYVDVKSAFTSVSHKATDVALGKAGASDKTRRIFRL